MGLHALRGRAKPWRFPRSGWMRAGPVRGRSGPLMGGSRTFGSAYAVALGCCARGPVPAALKAPGSEAAWA
jgi:hypothetical protein